MKTKAYLTTIIATLIATFGVIGLVETVGADPDGSQRLRGLGDRVFFVQVDVVVGGTTLFAFPNCYVFEDGGNWYETGFPTFGTWTQNSNGAKTSYSVNGDQSTPLTQVGLVTPAGGKGVLQLSAVSTTPAAPGVTFISKGAEIDQSEVGLVCPSS